MWDVRFVILCCGVLCCVVMCDVGAGVGVQCVVCVLCVPCVVCVARLGTRKNPPCVGSKRPGVCVQNVNVCTGTTSTCFSACGRDVLNLHTGTS